VSSAWQSTIMANDNQHAYIHYKGQRESDEDRGWVVVMVCFSSFAFYYPDTDYCTTENPNSSNIAIKCDRSQFRHDEEGSFNATKGASSLFLSGCYFHLDFDTVRWGKPYLSRAETFLLFSNGFNKIKANGPGDLECRP
jgi:hypothetical protein